MEIKEDYISFLKDLKKLTDDFWKNVDELDDKHREKIIHPNCFSRWNDLIQNLKFGVGNDSDELRKWIFNLINSDIREKIDEMDKR